MASKRLLAGLIVVVGLAGCGGSSHAAKQATLVLDFTPNAVHAGIYLALQRGYPQKAGVALHVQVPGASTDSVKLLLSGRAQFAILDIHDLAIAREQGNDLVGVMALVQRPLASVVALPPFKTPRDLEGHTVGVSGLPSDQAVLRSIVSGAGGDPDKVHQLTIGFNAVPDLIAGKVDAATAFWNDEGIAVHARKPDAHVFRVDEFGAPAYPELVLTVTRAELRKHPDVVSATVKALVHGYEDTERNAVAGANALVKAVPSLDRAEVLGELVVLLPAFTAAAPRFGDVDPVRLAPWAVWEKKFGLVKRLPDTRAMFDDRYDRAASSATS
jgi:putative hydroxymethylpyrimidine transport system substrate-binding protein